LQLAGGKDARPLPARYDLVVDVWLRLIVVLSLGLGGVSCAHTVTIDADFGDASNGVLYAVGGAAGGLAVYMDKGELFYEYNMMIIENTQVRAGKIGAGKHQIVIETKIEKPGGQAQVVIKVDGAETANARVPRTVPAAFSATESFDVGMDFGSPVSLAYEEHRPFAFDGKISTVRVQQ
jgi:arylsulfatase